MKMASPRSRHAVISGRAAPARTNVMSPPDASDMMVEPNGTVDAAQTLTRAVKDYVERDDRFSLERKIYGQYFQLYYQRLMLLLPRLKEAVAAKWPGSAPHIKVLDLKEGEECVIMGTLYKDMKLKPSILDDYVKEAGLGGTSEVKSTKFVSDDDSFVLEDEGARVKLVGPAANVDEFVTGVVLAAKGRVIANGEFEADEISALAPQTPIAKSSAPDPGRTPPSSPVCASATLPPPTRSSSTHARLPHGNLGGAAEQSAAASVARVVVAGGALPAAEVPRRASTRDNRRRRRDPAISTSSHHSRRRRAHVRDARRGRSHQSGAPAAAPAPVYVPGGCAIRPGDVLGGDESARFRDGRGGVPRHERTEHR